MKNLLKYMKPCWHIIGLAAFLKIVGTLFETVIPYLMGIVIDEGIANNNVPQIIKLCTYMGICACGIIIFNAVAHYFAAMGSQKVAHIIRNKLYKHIQSLDISQVEEYQTASLITRVTNDVEHIQNAVMMSCRMLVRAPIIVISGTVMSLLIDPYLTVVMFVGMVCLCVASLSVYRFTRPLYKKVQKNLDALSDILRENLSGIKVIKSFNRGAYEIRRFDKTSSTVKENSISAGKINGYMTPAITLISNMTIIVALLISAVRVEAGVIEIGKVVTILNYINNVLNAMNFVPRICMIVSRASTSAARIEEVLDTTGNITFGEHEECSEDKEVIRFEDVSFTYEKGQHDALKNISFSIDRGETVGIIGATGSGKSTIFNLIFRLYDATTGKIILNGRDITSYAREDITDNITGAMQQYNILSMSVKDNIILDKAYDSNKLDRASNTAQISDLIDGLEGGYEHIVSQNGTNLSGGQKQRISIARTLYRDSQLLVLDDVSSALDYKTDLKLRRAIRDKYTDTAVVIISQRVSSVKNADKIIVLHNGIIEGIGTHDELSKNCDRYKEICTTQERARHE